MSGPSINAVFQGYQDIGGYRWHVFRLPEPVDLIDAAVVAMHGEPHRLLPVSIDEVTDAAPDLLFRRDTPNRVYARGPRAYASESVGLTVAKPDHDER